MFDQEATADLCHSDKAFARKRQPSADHPFVAATAKELAAAIEDERNDLSALHAKTLATSLHLHSARRFSDFTQPQSRDVETVDRALAPRMAAPA